MIGKFNPAMTHCLTSPDQKHRSATILIQVITLVCSIALLVFLILLSLCKIELSQSFRAIVMSLVYTALISLPSMFLLNWIWERYGENRLRIVVLIQALALVCTATIGCLVGGLLLYVLGISPHSDYRIQFKTDLPFSIIISLIIGLSLSFYGALQHKLQAATLELRTRQVEQERADKLLAEAQLSSLESRIHPHFLFNTLNSISALIPTDPQRAEDTVGKLASLLRFSLSANPNGLVPLSQELKIVRDYLEIEKTRFGARLLYEIAVPETLEDVKVPPLALQSLVENSVKHVASQRTQGAVIRIQGALVLTESVQRIRLEVIDNGPGFSLQAITPEHGLGNLVARLDLLFGEAGQLEVTRKGEESIVALSFPA